ncbi:MAG: arylesterase [Ectothiorhodospiraceae bacterium AqS1]|nr:arylesterase [Ectothiorhodospiraceae bacterium AqS1]
MRKKYPHRFSAALVLGLGLASGTGIPGGFMVSNAALAADPPTIAMLGDSLTAGYGLPAADALPARLEEALRERYPGIRVLNAGVSGNTIAEGLARLEWVLADRPDAVIVALGANDVLRAIAPRTSRSYLDRILAELERRDLPTLVAGMRAPRNLGLGYTRRFDAIYPDLAERYDALLYPFLLEGVAAVPELNLMVDGNPDLHPNREGVKIIAERMLPMVICLVERIEGFRPSISRRSGRDPNCA